MDPSYSLTSANNMQMISYHLSNQTCEYYNAEIDDLCSEIDQLNKKNLTWEDGIILSNLFKKSLNFLEENNKNEELKTKLRVFLPKVFKIEKLFSINLAQAEKIKSLLNSKKSEENLTLNSLCPTPPNMWNQITKRELSGLRSIESHKDLQNQLIIQNIKEGNYTKTIYNGHIKNLENFDIQGDLAVTRSFGEMKLWDLKQAKCLRTLDGKWNQEIKIVGKHVFCADLNKQISFEINADHPYKTRVIELESGKEIDKDTEISNLFCVVGDQIFSYRDENMEKTGPDGKTVPLFNVGRGKWLWLLGSENFLVLMNCSEMIIYDLLGKSQKKLCLTDRISCAYIHGDFLICGFANGSLGTPFATNPECCLIDLKRCSIVDQYQMTSNRSFFFTDEHFLPEKEYMVKKVIMNKEWAFWGYSTGKICAINLINKKRITLGYHTNKISELALDGQILISISNKSDKHGSAEIKFWDIKSMTKIKKMKFPILIGDNISFADGNLYIAVGKSLIKFDYLVSHKGEKMAENSASEIVEADEFYLDQL
jgi:hypothetical protein